MSTLYFDQKVLFWMGGPAGLTDGEARNETSYSPVGTGIGAELGNKDEGLAYTNPSFLEYPVDNTK